MDYSYIAGFFDGEGCISASLTGRGKATLSMTVSLTNTKVDVLERIQAVLGYGTITHQIDRRGGGVYRLRVHKRSNIRRFIESVGPYSTIKQDKLYKGLEIIKRLDTGEEVDVDALRRELAALT